MVQSQQLVFVINVQIRQNFTRRRFLHDHRDILHQTGIGSGESIQRLPDQLLKFGVRYA